MLLSVGRIGVRVSLVEAAGIGIPGVTEDGGVAPTGGLEVVDVEELVELLPTAADAELEVETELSGIFPEGTRPPVWVVVGVATPLGEKYSKVRVAVGVLPVGS